MQPKSNNSNKPIKRTSSGPSFSLNNRLIRLSWNIVWIVFASWTPNSMAAWRRFLLRLFGAKMGNYSNVRGSARIWLPSNLIMGHNSLIGPHVNCYNQAPIHIGNRALISQGAYLCSGSHDIDDPLFSLITSSINIGDFVWIASDAFIGPGCNIEEGTVVGARAVAFGTLKKWNVYCGNPVKLVRTRKQNRKKHFAKLDELEEENK